jgi:aspartyl-tRNA(Asn)/glutamyl-tRNA(Gln) amidotransferase subunit A
MHPYKLTLTQASGLIQKNELLPIDLAESLLERIGTIESTIKAWVTVDAETVLKEAERTQGEKIKSNLHGIPVGIKDIYFIEGQRTSMGSTIFKDFMPSITADVVSDLRKSGALILGKTETTEFALHDPAPTRNPWNIRHTPGGSSSGSAAAVSSGMCHTAFGSQTGGSVIRPASYCGIVGVKPTYDLISRGGVYPLSWSLDHVGYMTRSVKDAHLIHGVLTGKDSVWIDIEKSPKIGLLGGYFHDNATPEVWEAYEKTVAKLCGEGADFVDASLPDSFKCVPDVHRIIMAAETASVHEDLFKKRGADYGEYIRGFISSGLLVPATSYLRAQRIRGEIIKDIIRVIKKYDCIVCPSTVDTAPEGLEWTGSPAFNSPWSLTGLPSITIPSGLSREKLPLGFQIIGVPFSEWSLLGIAGWCEEKLGFGNMPKDPVIY